MDEAKLPIEYVLKQNRYTVEVARATVTQVNFTVLEQYGINGQVVYADKSPVADAVLSRGLSSTRLIQNQGNCAGL